MYNFTKKEIETLELISHGLTNYDIAAYLHLSVRTIEMRLSNIKEKIVNVTNEPLTHRSLAIFAYKYIQSNGGLRDED
jgi:DNA-binding NarL/FixJ family response regulator